MLRRLSTQKWF